MKKMRRFKQKMNEEEILDILDRNTHGVLSVCGMDDYPYAVALSYVRIHQSLYFHCAKSGYKVEAILHDPHVSFMVVDEDTIVPEKFTTYFRSVIVFGQAHIVDNEEERQKAFHALMDKYSPDIDRSLKNEEFMKAGFNALIICIEIESMSGKKAIEYV